MRKNLTRFFSLLLAALTAMSVSAAPLATRKMKAPEAETTQLKAADAKVKTKAPAKADRRSRVISPKFRTADTRRASNLFRSAAPGTTMRVKAPYKAATAADAEVPELLGSVTWSDSWGRDEPMTGFYGIPTNASQNFDLKFLGPNANYGGVLIGDVYYVCDVWEIQGWVMSVNYRGYNVESGEEVYDQAHSYHTNTMTYDSTTGTIYAIATIEDDLALVKLSFEENEVVFEPVGAINTNALGLWNSIACDSKGQLWGVFANYVNAGESYECVSSTLYKIDKTTCAATKIGDTGFDCPYASDATFDLKTDRLYWTVCTASDLGLLTEINTSTGAATVVYAFPFNEEVTGLAVAAPAADDKAPAAVTDAKADFENGSLTGTVSFKAPVTLFDGTPATGDLTYTVTANGQEIATGTTAFGAEVSKEVTMTESGSYNFTFTVANSTGSSPKVQLKNVYVGKDTPAAPAVTVVYDAATGVATVSWTAVTGTVNGGFMDASAVTYTVTRYPDETVVAQNTSATTVTDLLPATEGMSKYYYSVVASCDGLSSAAGVSGNILVGTGLVPPFTETFDADDALDLFTVIDANGDGTTWKINNGKASVGYNSSLNMDDWLISPPIRLEGGKLYDVVADLWVEASGYPERFEVKIGKTHTVAGMTTTVLGPTDVTTTSANPYKLSTPVVVDEAGVYYIGIHGISDKDKYNLNFDNFGVTAPRSAEGPAAVSNLTAVADPSGALSVVISFVTPDKTMSGNALTSIDKVELSRNGTVVNTWQNPAPGQSLTFTDKPAEGGDMLYSVAAYNADGAGLVSEVSVAVGFDYPEVPSNVKMVETSTPGEVTITWDAVTTDIKGTPLPASEVSYQVCSSPDGYTLIAVSGKLTETSYTFQAVAPGEQDFVQYVVVASTSKGEGNGRYTPFIPVGTPYTTFSMSSGADLQKYALAMNSAGGASWRTATNETFTDVPEAADGDNYYFIMVGQYIEDSAMLYTGKIDLSATPAPAMVLYNLPLAPDDDNTLTVSVTDVATGESKVIYSKPVNQSGTPLTWNKLTFDLSAYAQKTVQLSVEGVINGYQYFLIDGWKVASMLENDLAIAAVEAPEKVKAGDAFTVDVTVSNEGVKDAGAFTVELYADGKLADTKAVESLAADSRTVVKFDATLSALATEAVTYTAKVVYAADENAANNEGASVTVTPVLSTYPAPTGLTATSTDNSVKLAWSEPDLNSVESKAVTEDFEDGNAFSDTFGDWIFVDVDKMAVGGFQNLDVPGINAGYSLGSFWIWDQSQLGNATFAAHSGTKYLFSLYRDDSGKSNEWAISPELDGSAQTISLYARSYSGTYPEKLQLCYSTGSTEPADFTVVKTVDPVASVWTLYKFDVPAGAKRFAINSCATDAFMLLVDDVTFIPALSAADLDIKGYDVYRDGVKINDAPVEECAYTDTNLEHGKSYEYAVVAIYTKGLSAPSNVATVLYQGAGIDSVYAGELTISATRNSVIVTGAAGQAVAVYAVDGKTVFAGQGEARTVIPVKPGVYVVKAGNTVKKVKI